MSEKIEYISSSAGLTVLLVPEVVHYSAAGRTIVANAKFAKFNNGFYSHDKDDKEAIAILDKCRDCKRFETAERELTEAGEPSRIVVNDAEWITKGEAEQLLGSPKDLKKYVGLGTVKVKKTTSGDRYNARQINDIKLDLLGVSR